jgi:hypothetical protein
VKIGEAHAVRGQLVQVRRADHAITEATQVAVAEVIAEDDQDIRPPGGGDGGRHSGSEETPARSEHADSIQHRWRREPVSGYPAEIGV